MSCRISGPDLYAPDLVVVQDARVIDLNSNSKKNDFPLLAEEKQIICTTLLLL